MKKFRFILILLIVALAFGFVACNRGGGARSADSRSGDSGEATLSELLEAIEAAQQMLGSGTTAPPAAAPSTPAPSSSGSARGGDASWKWTAVSDSAISSMDIIGIAYGGGRFVATGVAVVGEGQGYSAMVYSTDGTSWTAVPDHPLPSWITAIAWGSGVFVAGDRAGNLAYSANGINWTAVTDQPFATDTHRDSIYGIAYGGGRFVAVGGNIIAYADW